MNYEQGNLLTSTVLLFNFNQYNVSSIIYYFQEVDALSRKPLLTLTKANYSSTFCLWLKQKAKGCLKTRTNTLSTIIFYCEVCVVNELFVTRPSQFWIRSTVYYYLNYNQLLSQQYCLVPTITHCWLYQISHVN